MSGLPGELSLVAPGGTDLFRNPDGQAVADTAPRRLVEITGEFTLSADAHVAGREAYDSGALLVWADDGNWAKLEIERFPNGSFAVVSVVTRDVSDTAVGWTLPRPSAHLVIARRADEITFAVGRDPARLVRHFGLGPTPDRLLVGLLAQSPLGTGCTATFRDVHLRPSAPSDLRFGS